MTAQPKILIIGNGFDLAHKMPTSYADFANFYIENKIVPEIEGTFLNKPTSNDFFKPIFLKSLRNRGLKSQLSKDSLINELYWSAASKKPHQLANKLKENTNQIDTIISNTFLGKLYRGNYDHWFDIEHAFFQEILIHKNTADRRQDSNRLVAKEGMIKLNREFLEIKKALFEYLETVRVKKNHVVQHFLDTHLKGVSEVYILNFNYTSTIEQYILEYTRNQNIETNYIHGSLDDDHIIFGYGNDKDPVYDEIKNLEIDEFLKHFKPIEYQNHNSYGQLYERALDKFKSYDVLVIGHSLGTTDKTLLSEILNTPKLGKLICCKRKDLEHQPELVQEEFTKLNMKASRIFSDELTKRKKMVNFTQSPFFPG